MKKKRDTGCWIDELIINNYYLKTNLIFFNRMHLEHVYRLCQMCDKYVKTKLSQDERKYKPNLLAWKLELSKKHFQTNKMVVKSVQFWVSSSYFVLFYIAGWKYLQKK